MSEVMVRDVVIWTKHVHGDAALKAKLNSLAGGSDVELIVDGVQGHWRKMSDGGDGRPTTGLAPQGRMAAFWRELYATRRGTSVTISLPRNEGAMGGPNTPTSGSPSFDIAHRTREAVEAARAAFLAPRGWSSEGRTVTRDELYDR